MAEAYACGLWTVRSGEEDAFVEAWKIQPPTLELVAEVS